MKISWFILVFLFVLWVFLFVLFICLVVGFFVISNLSIKGFF